MNVRRRPLVFIALNICLSFLVTGTMLLVYDRAYRRDCGSPLAIATSQPGTASPLPGNVVILGVVGPGSAADETVLLQNEGREALVLTGWHLQNGQDRVYTFPELTLYPGGLVEVHTTVGADSASDLYLGSSSPRWSSGQLVVLYDSGQVARAIYRIP